MKYFQLAGNAALILLKTAAAFAADAPSPTFVSSNLTLANPLATQPLEELSATLDRPLFSPSRRPVPTPTNQTAPLPAPSIPPPDLVLSGIVMDGKSARAIVQVGSLKRTVRAQIGDNIDGWTVSRIEERKLTLSLDGRFATFALFSRGGTSDAASKAINPSATLQPLQLQLQSPSVTRDSQRNRRRMGE